MADPDLQRGWSSRPRDGGWGEEAQKKFLQPFGPHFGLKIRWAQGLSPGSATAFKDWTCQAELQTKAYMKTLKTYFSFSL